MEEARYRANCLPAPREPCKRDTVDLAPRAMQEQAGNLVSRSMTLSSVHVSTVGGIRHSDHFSRWPQKRKHQ